jgi:hypothetical protein
MTIARLDLCSIHSTSIFQRKGVEMEVVRRTDGKVIGTIDDGRTFRKNVDSSKHFLKTPSAICIDVDIWEQIEPKTDFVEIYTTDTQTIYFLSTQEFNDAKFKIDRGHGAQYAVLSKVWRTRNNLRTQGV